MEPPRANFSISAGATQTADAQRFLLVLDNSVKPSDRQKPQTPPAQISTQKHRVCLKKGKHEIPCTEELKTMEGQLISREEGFCGLNSGTHDSPLQGSH